MKPRIIKMIAILALGMVASLKAEVTTTTTTTTTKTTDLPEDEKRVARDFFENTLYGLMHQRRMFLDGYGNATELLQKQFGAKDTGGEARGKKKRLKQMNRTLIAIVMAYTLKFLFLVPTFIGTLVLFKFTVGIAGFFYALFAAVLGLDHHHPHHDH